MANLYETLGVSKTATQSEIKKAYHKLARTLHPDVNPDKKAAEKFKKVSAAYELLSNTDKRKRYDAGEIDENGNPTPFGAGSYDHTSGFRGNPFGAGGTRYQTHNINPEEFVSMFGGGMGGFDFTDLFGMGRTAGRRSSNPFGANTGMNERGNDVNYELTIPFELAIKGGESQIRLSNGKNLKIKIPAGIMPGSTLRLKGQGEAGYNGKTGDALITIKVTESQLYRMEGTHLILTLPISLKEAVLGAKLTLPSPFETVKMTIPEFSSSGKTFRLKSKGMGGKGDLLVKLSIQLPRSNHELKEFIKNWNHK